MSHPPNPPPSNYLDGTHGTSSSDEAIRKDPTLAAICQGFWNDIHVFVRDSWGLHLHRNRVVGIVGMRSVVVSRQTSAVLGKPLV